MDANVAEENQRSSQSQLQGQNRSASQNHLGRQNQSASHHPSRGQNRSTSHNASRGTDRPASRSQSKTAVSQSQGQKDPAGLQQPSGLIETDNINQPTGQTGDLDDMIEAVQEEQRPTRQSTGASRAIKSVAESYADDEWSDVDNPPQPLSDRQYHYLPKRRYGRQRDCDCYPAVSKPGQPSMIYEKLYCKHSKTTGQTHQQAKVFSNNWTNAGQLPPIHKTDFVVKRPREKPKKNPKYTVLMGYPTSMYGYNEASKVAKETEAESQDADDESDYTEDSDAETVKEDEGEEEAESDEEVEEETISKNRRDQYQQKAVKRTVVTSFSSRPRAVMREYRSFLEEEGYMGGDEVYANYDYLRARIKKGRNLNGKFLNPVSGKLEHFDMKTEGQIWEFSRELVDKTT